MDLKDAKRLIFTIIILGLISFSACTQSPSTISSSSPTITTTLSQSPTPSPTPTLISTETPIPTTTINPTQTPIPVSSVRIEDVEILKSSIMTFSLDGNIWVIDRGKKRQVTFSSKDSSPKISPSGEHIIFIRSTWVEHEWSEESCRSTTLSNLMRINIDGSDEKVIVPADQILPFYTEKPVMYDDENVLTWCGIGIDEFSIQPIDNPEILLFSTSTESRYGRMDDLFSYNLSSKEIKQLVLPMQGGVSEISPNGMWVASANAFKLDLISLTNFQIEERILEFQPTHEGPPYIYFPRLKWHLDSDSIFVVTEAGEPFQALEYENAVWEIKITNLNVRKISQFPVSSFSWGLMTGRISPSLEKIIFPCPETNTISYSLCISNLDGSELKTVTPIMDEIYWLAWSPDSKSVIFNYNTKVIVTTNGEIEFWNLDEIGWSSAIWLQDDIVLLTYTNRTDTSTPVYLINTENREVLEIEDLPSVSDILHLDSE